MFCELTKKKNNQDLKILTSPKASNQQIPALFFVIKPLNLKKIMKILV